jgi:uncharacterized protein with PQ loop repeat
MDDERRPVFGSEGNIARRSVGWRVYYSYFVSLWAVASQAAYFTQALSVYSNRDVSGLSLPTYVILVVSNVIWFVYGAWAAGRAPDVPIIVSATLGFCVTLSILVGILLYRDDA